MPLMVATKSFTVSETGEVVRPGKTFSVSDGAAKSYEKRGRAYLKISGAPVKPEANKAAEKGPFVSPGGPTGAAAQPQSLPAERRPPGRPSNASKAAATS